MVETEADSPFMIIYTSGTTGRPKGTVHVHGGFPVKATQDMAHCFDVGEQDRLLWFTDIGWMMGPWAICGALSIGATLVLYDGVPDHPGPDRLWSVVERHRVTVLGIAPTVIRALMRNGDEPVLAHDLSSLRVLGSTGEPWNTDPWLWYQQKIGGGRLPVINYSGGTEISGGILAGNVLTPLQPCAFAGPCPGMAADVVDENGRSVRDRVGELVIRAPWPGMTQGFWRDRERYLDTYWSRWPGVWVHGDWCEVDADGLWYIRGRSDDTIKVAGKRLGPAEVESALVAHRAVAEAAAIGVPDPLKGEALVVFVVLKPGVTDSPELRTALARRVADEMGKALAPHAVEIVSELPKTRNAKVLRRVVRSVYLGNDPGDLSSLENHSAIDALRAGPHDALTARCPERRSTMGGSESGCSAVATAAPARRPREGGDHARLHPAARQRLPPCRRHAYRTPSSSASSPPPSCRRMPGSRCSCASAVTGPTTAQSLAWLQAMPNRDARHMDLSQLTARHGFDPCGPRPRRAMGDRGRAAGDVRGRRDAARDGARQHRAARPRVRGRPRTVPLAATGWPDCRISRPHRAGPRPRTSRRRHRRCLRARRPPDRALARPLARRRPQRHVRL